MSGVTIGRKPRPRWEESTVSRGRSGRYASGSEKSPGQKWIIEAVAAGPPPLPDAAALRAAGTGTGTGGHRHSQGGRQGHLSGTATGYGIVKQSGGHVEADSTPGKGSTFRLFFPVVDEEAAAPAEAQAPAAVRRGKEGSGDGDRAGRRGAVTTPQVEGGGGLGAAGGRGPFPRRSALSPPPGSRRVQGLRRVSRCFRRGHP